MTSAATSVLVRLQLTSFLLRLGLWLLLLNDLLYFPVSLAYIWMFSTLLDPKMKMLTTLAVGLNMLHWLQDGSFPFGVEFP